MDIFHLLLVFINILCSWFLVLGSRSWFFCSWILWSCFFGSAVVLCSFCSWFLILCSRFFVWLVSGNKIGVLAFLVFGSPDMVEPRGVLGRGADSLPCRNYCVARLSDVFVNLRKGPVPQAEMLFSQLHAELQVQRTNLRNGRT